ncbi:MAG: YraN family protein [Patescibacteria group bacterium]
MDGRSKNKLKKQIGKAGEGITVMSLKKSGYTIIECNKEVRIEGKKYLEIDVIAEKNNIIYLFEVKTRQNKNLGSAIEQISKKKIEKVSFFCDIFYPKRQVQFVIVEVNYNISQKTYEINYHLID